MERDRRGREGSKVCVGHFMSPFNLLSKQPQFCVCAKAPCSVNAKHDQKGADGP